MADRRMFSKNVIDTDLFLDMPLSTQALYFHLSMRADDDGFITNPRKIQKMVGASEDDLKILVSKNFIIPFESGVVVIKHWKIHNYIRNDRKKVTSCIEEATITGTNDKGEYYIDPNINYNDSIINNNYYNKLNNNNNLDLDLGKDRLEKEKYIINNNIPKENTEDVSHLVDSMTTKCQSVGIPNVSQVVDTTTNNNNKRFVKPTLEEVVRYVCEKDYSFNPEAFHAFYESKGWKVGNQPMKDWKACCRTWQHKQNTSGYSNYEYDRKAQQLDNQSKLLEIENSEVEEDSDEVIKEVERLRAEYAKKMKERGIC